MAGEAGNKATLFRTGVPVLGGRFRLYVTPDGLEAYLKIEDEHQLLSTEDLQRLRQELQKLGIVHGILDPPEYSPHTIIVARGTPPIRGKDGCIEVLVDLERGPKEKDGKIDLRELNSIVCVRAGQAVARKIPPTPGESGMDVFGQPIPPTPGKEVNFKYGKGLEVSPDGSLLLAKTDGVLINEGGKFKIQPVYCINSDIDWDIGNIHFRGEKLTIRGDVKPGFLVEAWGDLEIHGRVENDVTIRVFGDLTILGPVQGEETIIDCEGDASLSIVEYATLSIGGNLSVKEYLLSAQCRVGGNLQVIKGVGKIVGGKYHVRESVVAQILGSSAHVNTLIKAGYDEFLQERLEELSGQIGMAEEILDKLTRALITATRLYKEGRLKKEKVTLLEKIRKKYKEVDRYLEELKQQKQHILETLESLKGAHVQVLKEIYPGVEIWITDKKFKIFRHLPGGIFYYQEKKILFKPKG